MRFIVLAEATSGIATALELIGQVLFFFVWKLHQILALDLLHVREQLWCHFIGGHWIVGHVEHSGKVYALEMIQQPIAAGYYFVATHGGYVDAVLACRCGYHYSSQTMRTLRQWVGGGV